MGFDKGFNGLVKRYETRGLFESGDDQEPRKNIFRLNIEAWQYEFQERINEFIFLIAKEMGVQDKDLLCKPFIEFLEDALTVMRIGEKRKKNMEKSMKK